MSSNKLSLSSMLPHIGAMVAVTMWGMSFVSTKMVMQDGGLGPTAAYVYRFIIAYVIILLFSHRRMWANNWIDETLLALCGMLSGSIYFILENTALEYTLTANVSLLTSTSPLITVLFAGLMYKSEKPGRGLIIGSVVACAGMVCVILNSTTSLEVRPLGDMLALLAATCWAMYSLILKRLNVLYDSLFITRKTFAYGIITALPFLAFEPGYVNITDVIGRPVVFVNLLFLAIGASCTGFYLWSVAVKNIGAVRSNNYLYFQTIVTLVASYFILGEHIGPIGYIGFTLILFGLWLGDYLEKKRQ